MNGAEQRERFTSVQRLETRLARRLEDLELVVDAQTALIGKQKELLEQDLQVFIERQRVTHEGEAHRLDGLRGDLTALVLVLPRPNTLWHRLRWLLTGRV